MNKQKIQKFSREHIEFAENMQSLNSPIHMASGITTWIALWFFAFSKLWQYPVFADWGNWLNAACCIAACLVAWRIETIFERMSTSFAKMVVLKTSWRIMALASSVVIILGVFTISTSALGAKEGVKASTDTSGKHDIAELRGAVTASASSLAKEANRAVLNIENTAAADKKEIEARHNQGYKAAVKAAKARYKNKGANEWEQQQYDKTVAAAESKMIDRKSKELATLSAATNKKIERVQEQAERQQIQAQKADDIAMNTAVSSNKKVDGWVDGFGNALSVFIAVLVLLSIGIKIGTYFLYYGVHESFPKHKPSPTLSVKKLKKWLKGTKKTQKRGGGGVNSPKNSGRGGAERSKPAEIDRFEQPQQQPVFEFDVPQNHRNKGNKSGLTGLKQQILDQYAICNDASRSSQERADASELMNELTEQLNESGQGIDFDDKDRISFSELTLF